MLDGPLQYKKEKKMKKVNLLIALAFSFVASGCANKVHTYATSTDNTVALRALAKSDQKVNLGEWVNAGTSVLTIVNTSNAEITFNVPLNIINGLKKGDIYVSNVIGEYITSGLIGTFTKEKAKMILAQIHDKLGSKL